MYLATLILATTVAVSMTWHVYQLTPCKHSWYLNYIAIDIKILIITIYTSNQVGSDFGMSVFCNINTVCANITLFRVINYARPHSYISHLVWSPIQLAKYLSKLYIQVPKFATTCCMSVYSCLERGSCLSWSKQYTSPFWTRSALSTSTLLWT